MLSSLLFMVTRTDSTVLTVTFTSLYNFQMSPSAVSARLPHITLCVTRSLPALSDDSLDPAAPTSSSHSSSSSPPSTLLLGETQEEEPVVASPTRSLIDETLVPHSLLPVLPPVTGQDGSLANVFVPLDAIEPSESSALLNMPLPNRFPECT